MRIVLSARLLSAALAPGALVAATGRAAAAGGGGGESSAASGVFLRASSSSNAADANLRAGAGGGELEGRRQRRSLAISGCPGGDGSDFSVTFTGACKYENLRNAVDAAKDVTTCTATADELLLDLLGETNTTTASSAVRDLCSTAYSTTSETFPFSSISKKGTQFDNEYYSGGTIWNYEVQNDEGRHVLKDDAARVGRVLADQAQRKVIDLPEYLPSFDPDGDGCDLNAAFCCWVQDRQAGDNNGDCNTPYDSQCIDEDPGDNTNFCYTDHSRSSGANHVTGGFSVFGNVLNGQENIEGAVHCHGFAWAQDDADPSAAYRGNNLFFVSMYDHMHQRGYVRNAPGSAMCACAENMAVVTRADCTEIAASETFRFDYSASAFSFTGVLTQVNNIDFNACTGAEGGQNNDLESYYQRLVDEGKQTQSNLNELRKILVGTQAGNCNTAIKDFMRTKGIITKAEAAASAPAGMVADGMVAEGMVVEEAKPSKSTVESVDIAYEKASGGGDGQSMPEVPTDQQADAMEEDPEQPADAAEANPEPLEPEVSPETEETETTSVPTGLKLAGESCEAGPECLSGKCLGKGECAEVKSGGGGSTKEEAAEADEMGCVSLGQICRNDGQCCDGACEGKGSEKRCEAFDVLE